MNDNLLHFYDTLFSDPLEGPSRSFHVESVTSSFVLIPSSPPPIDDSQKDNSSIQLPKLKLEILQAKHPYLIFLTNKHHVYVVVYLRNKDECVANLDINLA